MGMVMGPWRSLLLCCLPSEHDDDDDDDDVNVLGKFYSCFHSIVRVICLQQVRHGETRVGSASAEQQQQQ